MLVTARGEGRVEISFVRLHLKRYDEITLSELWKCVKTHLVFGSEVTHGCNVPLHISFCKNVIKDSPLMKVHNTDKIVPY